MNGVILPTNGLLDLARDVYAVSVFNNVARLF